MISNRLLRYGYGDVLYRVLTVRLNDNVACRGGALHRVDAVAVATGRPAFWWVTDGEVDRYR
jgi:hypothetical protein